MCSCGRRCSSVLFKKRGTCKIPSVHSASHLLPAFVYLYRCATPTIVGRQSTDRLWRAVLREGSARSPRCPLRLMLIRRRGGVFGRGLSVACRPGTGPPPLAFTVRALVVSPLWLKPEPFMSAQAFEFKPTRAQLLTWDEPEPSSLATTHKKRITPGELRRRGV